MFKGDLVPVSPLGKFFASIAAFSGIIIIAMPVGVIGSNFSEFYRLTEKKEFILRMNNLNIKSNKRKFK